MLKIFKLYIASFFIISFFLVISLELMFQVLVSLKPDYMYLHFMNHKFLELNKTQQDEYFKNFNKVTGWPSTNDDRYDQSGKRKNLGLKETNTKDYCISIFGDSFTFSSEVDFKDSWGAVLGNKLNCSIENYGVEGFGVDQSVLRFLEKKGGESQVVLLGIFTDDIARNLNTMRSLLNLDQQIDIRKQKPRFVETDNGLTLQEIYFKNSAQYMKSKDEETKILKNEYFLEGDYAKVRFNKLRSISLLKLVYKKISNLIKYNIDYQILFGVLPETIPLYVSQKESLSLNDKIIQLFLNECKSLNKECFIVIIPDPLELFYSDRNFTELIYSKRNWEDKVIDLTPTLSERFNDKDICYFIGKNRDCSGHYNVEGYSEIGNAIYKELTRRLVF